MLPFRFILPNSVKIPVNGIFKVRSLKLPPFFMKANPTSHSAKVLFWNGVEGFEYHAVRIFISLAKESNLFLDIGSNLGYYSLLASNVSKKSILCHAFEPMPSAYDVLCENVQINDYKNVIPHKIALSNYNGDAKFFMIVNEKFSTFPN